MEMQREDGSTFFAEVTLSPLVGDDGVVVGLIAVGRDVTPRIEAEADAARLRAIVDAANEAILGVDTDGTVLFFSPSAERLFGWSAGEIIGRSGDELVAPRYRIGPPRLFAELAEHGSFRRPTVALRRDGTHVEVELSAAEIIGKHGSVIGAALTVMDVSERKRTRRLLDRIIEHAPNAIAVKDLDGRYLVFNWQSVERRAAELRRAHGRRPVAGGHGAAQRAAGPRGARGRRADDLPRRVRRLRRAAAGVHHDQVPAAGPGR